MERQAGDVRGAEWIADVLRQYDRVAKYRGTGISEVKDQKCMACQVMLRPQTYNEVRSDKLVSCESCQRILYYDPSHDHPAMATRKRRAHPKIEASQAWYYRAMHGEEGEVFLVFVNQRCGIEPPNLRRGQRTKNWRDAASRGRVPAGISRRAERHHPPEWELAGAGDR